MRPAIAYDWEALRRYDGAQAEALPEWVAARWREPAAWRALAGGVISGQRLIRLPGFVPPALARAWRTELEGLGLGRLDTSLVTASRRLLAGDEWGSWLDLMQGVCFRGLVGPLLGRALSEGLVVNAWRMEEGEGMGVHPDGPLYEGTLSLGLSEGEGSVERGGAIAFGEWEGADFVVRERWWPRLGDVAIFAPHETSFHRVEAVRGGGGAWTRWSVTGWWVAPEHGLTRGA